MKVIRVSNYDHEDGRGNQYVVAGPGLTPEQAEMECELRCNDRKRSDSDWYRVVPDDYKLFKFEP